MKRIDAERVGKSSAVMLICLVQFIAGFFIAVSLYPVPYHFSSNYISELGCVKEDSVGHTWVFNISLVVFSIGMMQFFAVLGKATFHGPIELLVVSGFALLSSISIFFIAVLPWDVFPGYHTLAMCLWLATLLPAISIWMEWVASMSDGTSAEGNAKRAASSTFGKSLRTFIFVFPVASVLGAGPALQKVIVLLSLVWLVVFTSHLILAIRRQAIRPGFAGRKRKRTSLPELQPGTFDGSDG